MIIQKFGGTSVNGVDAAARLLEIAKNTNKKSIFVLSALSGTTDRLTLAAELAGRSQIDDAKKIAQEILLNHLTFAFEIIKDDYLLEDTKKQVSSLVASLEEYLEGMALLSELTPRTLDSVLAYGERLSTTVYHYYFHSKNIENYLLDARTIIKTDSNFNNARVDFEASRIRAKDIENLMLTNDIIITQGFIASDEDFATTTLGRGGSDFSAAVFAQLLDAEELLIWTDVPGVMTADPRRCPDAQAIEEISFTEMSDMAYFGAKVLHPLTLEPAIKCDIPVKILNSMDPSGPGTAITGRIKDDSRFHSIVEASAFRLSVPAQTAAENMKNFENMTRLINQAGLKLYTCSFSQNLITYYFEDTPSKAHLVENIADEYYICADNVKFLCIFGAIIDNHFKVMKDILVRIEDKYAVRPQRIITSANKSHIILEFGITLDENVLNSIHDEFILK